MWRRPAGLADALGQRGLDVEVDVLAVGAELEFPGLDLVADRLQPADDGVAVRVADNALLREHAGVRDRAGDVLAVEAAVERYRGAVVLDELVGVAAKAPAPQLVGTLSRVVRHAARLASRGRWGRG